MGKTIKIYEVTCKRCNESWPPRKTDIKRCPRCKSPYWDKDRKVPHEKTK